jgi:dTDP-glucose 4,6-dehydratase
MRPKRSEVERLWADNAKARTLLRWKPSVPLEKGLSETIAWFSDPANLAFYKADRYNI